MGKGKRGFFFFYSNGDSPARYELVNLQSATSGTMEVATVGFYGVSLTEDHQFTMNNVSIVWGGRSETVHFHIVLFSYLWLGSQCAILHGIQ